ncbi:MAG: mechanosensitive ion channel [Moorea sp. SIO2B7]|nr:mechanosensitive ion channel [Moorena sp. SIO2B7]
MTQIIGTIMPSSPLILAQTDPINSFLSTLSENLGGSLLNIVWAIAALIIGWIIAIIVRGLTIKLLSLTRIDNKIANWITGGQSGDSIAIEKWIANIAYWFIIIFAVVAALQSLKLDAVSIPLTNLLTQITDFLPKLLGVGIWLAIAWLIATLAKLILTRTLNTLRLNERFGQQVSETSSENQNRLPLSETLGNAVYWFIFLLFLPTILETLGLETALTPLLGLLDQILSMLPNIFGALLIGAAGWLIAGIVRGLVTNLLSATGVDQIGAKFGMSAGDGRQTLSSILGTIAYVLILIPISISALETLKIKAISVPATDMLNQVLNILPNIFTASAILILAYIAGQYVSELVTNILTGIGFNDIFQVLGFDSPLSSKAEESQSESEQETVLQSDEATKIETRTTRTASELVGILALIAIMLVATLTAVDILGIEALTLVIGVILKLAAQVLVGLLVFAIGLYLANLAFNLITSSGSRQSKILGHTARISIIILISAIALERIGIAPNIINLAFGLLVGGIAVAIALAFGLGGRDIAAEQVRSWLDSFKQD